MNRRSHNTRLGLAITFWLSAALVGCTSPRVDVTVHGSITHNGASNPTVAMSSHVEGALLAWVSSQGSRADVFAARVGLDGSVTPPVRVNDIDGDAAPHEQAPAQIATAPNGDVYVVWQNNTTAEGRRFPTSNLRFARSTDRGSTFEPAIFVNDDALGTPSSHTFHNIAVTPSGLIVVSWLDGSLGDSINAHHAMSAPTDNTAHQHMGDGPGSQIRVALSRDGGHTFGPSIVVDDEVCPCCRTALAVGQNGEIHVAWRKVYPGNIRDVVVASSLDGGATFGAPIRVYDDGWSLDACPHAGPTIAIDHQNQLHVGWFTGVETHPGLYYAVSTDGGDTFSGRQRITQAAPPSQIRLLATSSSLAIAWEERTADGIRVQLGTLGRDRKIEHLDGGDVGRSPALATLDNTAAVAWLGPNDTVEARLIRFIP